MYTHTSSLHPPHICPENCTLVTSQCLHNFEEYTLFLAEPCHVHDFFSFPTQHFFFFGFSNHCFWLMLFHNCLIFLWLSSTVIPALFFHWVNFLWIWSDTLRISFSLTSWHNFPKTFWPGCSSAVALEHFPRWCCGNISACHCRRKRRYTLDSWVGKIPQRRKWQPAPIFLPGKFHGQKSLAGYCPWGHKEWDTSEQLSMHIALGICLHCYPTIPLPSLPLIPSSCFSL